MLIAKAMDAIFITKPFWISVITYCLYFWYLNRMFENDRGYQFLTETEREMSLTSEQALYYNYYKILTNPVNGSISHMLNQIAYDDRSQAPSTVNAFRHYQIFPEIFIGFGYRLMRTILVNYLKVDFEDWRRCYFIEDENDPERIVHQDVNFRTTCEGIGDPFYFYVYAVLALNSLVPVLCGLISYRLSDKSSCSMLFTIILFAFNQTNSSRVQWAVPLRENFGYPLFLVHVLWFIQQLDNLETFKALPNFSNFFSLTILIICQLLCWQFSSFILFVQSLAVYLSVELFPNFFYSKCNQIQKATIPMVNGNVMESFVQRYFLFNILAVVLQSFIQLGNVFILESCYFLLLSSYLSACLVVKMFWSAGTPGYFKRKLFLIVLFIIWNILIFRVNLISKIFHITDNQAANEPVMGQESDDSHIWMLLASKFNSAYDSFHTKLYTCAKEYDWLGWTHFYQLMTDTYLGPLILAAMVLQCTSGGWSSMSMLSQVKLAYICFVSIVFSLMAVLIMRLKLLMMPKLFIISGLIFAKKTKIIKSISSNTKWLVLSLVVAIISIKAVPRIQNNLQHEAMFENKPLEKILTVVREQTNPDSIFGGSMPTMATLFLTTGRRIANNPFYESSLVRFRTYQIYQLYSERRLEAVHRDLCQLKLDYIIMEPVYCFGRLGRCQMIQLWRLEEAMNNHLDNRRPEPVAKTRLCHEMLTMSRQAHTNENYLNDFFRLVAASDLYHLFRIVNCPMSDSKNNIH